MDMPIFGYTFWALQGEWRSCIHWVSKNFAEWLYMPIPYLAIGPVAEDIVRFCISMNSAEYKLEFVCLVQHLQTNCFSS